jgi:hypothetical protein
MTDQTFSVGVLSCSKGISVSWERVFRAAGIGRLAVVFVLLTFILPADAAEWEVRRFDHYEITYRPDDAPFADRVVNIIRRVTPDLIANIGIVSADTIHVQIADTVEEFSTFTGRAIPDWGEAYAVPDLNLIVLKSPRISGSVGNLREVVIHETAHILLHSAMRSADIPRWLDEGFAMYSAREWGVWDRASLILAVLTDNLVPLEEIRSVNTFSASRADLAYQESALAIQFVISRSGRVGLRSLLANLRKSGTINSATHASLGLNAVQFEQAWRLYMEETYGWRAVPMEALSLLLGPLFVVLFVLAYVSMRWRRRQVLKRWSVEEDPGFEDSVLRNDDEDRWHRLKREWDISEDRGKD